MNALKWITTEAKRLHRQYPNRFAEWKQYVGQASAIYAAKHKGKSPVGKKKKAVKKRAAVRRRVGSSFVWTELLKKKASRELLDAANNYEVKQRRSLRNIRFLPNGTARWIGQAHDYTVDFSNYQNFSYA